MSTPTSDPLHLAADNGDAAAPDAARLTQLETANASLVEQLDDRSREVDAMQARLRAATEAGEVGVWELDLADNHLFTTDQCKLNFGLERSSDFSYDQLLRAVHPDDQARMQAAVAHAVATGEDYRIEYRVRRPDGALAWVKVQAKVERDGLGRATRLLGTSQDSTDAMLARRRAAMLLALDSEIFASDSDLGDIAYLAAESLGKTLDVSRAGYGTIDEDNETITIERDWCAPGIASLAGALRFRDYGSYIEDLLGGETVVIADATLDPRTRDTARALIEISAQSVVNMPVTESGGLVALLYLNHASSRSWTDEELALIREVAQRVRQATERRRAELAVRDMTASLERKVEERTAALMVAEAALRQSQKMEAVGQLTGGLAHDFNNLLAAISGSLEVLKRVVPPEPKTTRYFDIGLNATKRAAALTHRLLAFSRQQTLEPKVLNANRLIGAFEELIRRTIGPAVNLEVVAGIGLWAVEADPGQLENALLNLCINARDAMPDGGRLVIETANRSVDDHSSIEYGLEPGQYVSICVSDNGTGMPPDVVARAFDPFFTTKPIGVGSGLGLSMVYGFAQQSGGQTRIYSEPGKGSNVCIYLPRHDGEPIATKEADSAVDVPVGEGQLILVVDDEAPVRMLVCDLLEELGYRVLQAGEGEGAIEILRADRSIKLLVTDVGLPGGYNGRQVAEFAREAIPDVKVLFITGYAENAVLSHGHLSPGMHILTKPFEMAALGQRVQSLLSVR